MTRSSSSAPKSRLNFSWGLQQGKGVNELWCWQVRVGGLQSRHGELQLGPAAGEEHGQAFVLAKCPCATSTQHHPTNSFCTPKGSTPARSRSPHTIT